MTEDTYMEANTSDRMPSQKREKTTRAAEAQQADTLVSPELKAAREYGKTVETIERLKSDVVRLRAAEASARQERGVAENQLNDAMARLQTIHQQMQKLGKV